MRKGFIRAHSVAELERARFALLFEMWSILNDRIQKVMPSRGDVFVGTRVRVTIGRRAERVSLGGRGDGRERGAVR